MRPTQPGRRIRRVIAVALVVLVLAVPAVAGSGSRTVRVSVPSGAGQGNAASLSPSISADGRFVAFASDASNLVRDTNGVSDIFVRDLVRRKTQRVSVGARGVQANGSSSPSTLDLVSGPSISATGRLVVFASAASNLVAGDSNGKEDVFVRDMTAHRTRRVSVGAHGAQGNGSSFQPVISTDGRFVAFASSASNLVLGGTTGTNIFVRDLKTHRTQLVSIGKRGAGGNGVSLRPSISEDGRLVAFESFATNLVRADTNGALDVFVRDHRTRTTERISVSSTGLQGNSGSYTGGQPSIARGRYIVFYSLANNLAGRDTNASYDVFVRDLQLHATRRISVSSSGAEGDSDSFLPTVSADGRFVAFESVAARLAPGNDAHTDHVYVRDLKRRRTRRLAHSSGGTLDVTRQQSEHADISADGRYVTFASLAPLVPRDTNHAEDVFATGPLRP